MRDRSTRGGIVGALDIYRCTLLQLSPPSVLQDRIDVGHMAAAQGDRDGALMLLVAVGLELGFAPDALAWWRRTGAVTGLWSVAWTATDHDGPRFCVDRAMDDMRAIAATVAATTRGDDVSLQPNAAGLKGAASADDVDDVFGLTARVRFALERFLAHPEPEVAVLIEALASDLAGSLPDMRQAVGAPTADLAALVGLHALRRRAMIAAPFARSPLGSSALVEQVARLSANGAGPWFAAVPRLIRTDEDLIVWPFAAAQGTLPPTALPAWCVLVAGSMPRDRWEGLMRQFARFGLRAGLEAVLERFARDPLVDTNRYESNALRDVCLDCRYTDLAIAAQRQVVEIHRTNVNDQVILADMLALAGRGDESFAILRELLDRGHDDAELIERAEAAGISDLQRYVATHGFFADAQLGAIRRSGMLGDVGGSL